MKEKLRSVIDYIVRNGKYIFPVLVCAAVAITVVIALEAGKVRQDELNQIGETISTPEPTAEPSSAENPDEVALVKNESQEILAVIEKYYTALAQGDEEGILSVCDKVEERHMLQWLETSKYIEYYPAMEIYTKPGFEAGDTVAYVYFKIKFTGKDAEYPSFERLYISTADDGTLYIRRTNLANDAAEYVQKISEQADVVELSNRVDVEFKDLMAQQPDLLVYMNDVREEVMRVVGEKLADMRQNEDGQGTEGGQGAEGGENGNQGNPPEGQDGQQAQDGQGGTASGNGGETPEPVYATATTTVNVRKSDSEKAEKIGRVTGGTKVQVLEQLVNGWTKIVYEKSEGYIMSKYLKVQESAVKYTVIGKVKATDNINVRAEASTDSAKMGTLVKGEKADLLAEEGEWCKINYKDQVAYVKAEYVEIQKD